MRKKVCKLIFLLVCCLLFALPLCACTKPLTVEQRPVQQTVQSTPEQTHKPASSVDVTEQTVSPHSWSVKINGRDITADELADSIEAIDIQVGCSQTTGYTLSTLSAYAAGGSISGLNIQFEDGSSMNIEAPAIDDTANLLITEKDGEVLEKPLLGFAAVIFPSPVAEIQVHS